jgi:predicted enzyme related to lactoylglutathione lyase
MTEINKPALNTFCWLELATSDPAAARKFYAALFGWELSDMPMPEGTYTMAKHGEHMVCGMQQLPEEAKKMGAPPHWLSYVAVESTDAAVAKAKELGGRLLAGPIDMGMGVMAVLQDPSDGVVAVWQSKQSMGTWLYQEPNSLCWNELATTNVDAAGKFYAGLFGWKPEAMKMPDMVYTVFKAGETQVGGMMPLPAQATGAPSMWTPYFSVKSTDGLVSQAEKLGAKVMMPATDIPNIGRFAVLSDPQGAAFAILQAPS